MPELSPQQSHKPRPRALVVGSTFGSHYVRALTHPNSPITLAGLVGRGSARSQQLAAEVGVPFYPLPDAPTMEESIAHADLPDVEMACVVVRSAISGGPGDDMVNAFLKRGITVVQEHPVHTTSVIDHLFTARNARNGTAGNSGGTARNGSAPYYALNSFYLNLPPVQNFLHCVQQVRQQSQVKAIEVRASIHVLYPVLDIVAHLIPGALPRLILQQPVQIVQHPAHPEVVNVSIDWGGTPVDIRLYNRIAPSDPDNHAQPLFACVMETADGELSLDHVHAPTRWQPRSHSVDGRVTADGNQLSCRIVGDPACAQECTADQIFHELWPQGVQRKLRQVWAVTTQEQVFGQKDLGVVQLWQDIVGQLPAPVPIDSVPPTPITFSAI